MPDRSYSDFDVPRRLKKNANSVGLNRNAHNYGAMTIAYKNCITMCCYRDSGHESYTIKQRDIFAQHMNN